MANVKELFEIAKDNRQLLTELYEASKAAVGSNATEEQIDKFKSLVERIRREIMEDRDKAVTGENGRPDPSLRKKMAEESLAAIKEMKQRQGLSEGDIALLDAREASLGITIASSSFDSMEPLGQLLSNDEWNDLKEHFEEAAKDLVNRKRAKAFLDVTVKLGILVAKVASKL